MIINVFSRVLFSTKIDVFVRMTIIRRALSMVSCRPIVLEVPHCASIRDREREVIVLRSDNGQTWREHITPADDTPLKDTPTNPTGDILGQCLCFLDLLNISLSLICYFWLVCRVLILLWIMLGNLMRHAGVRVVMLWWSRFKLCKCACTFIFCLGCFTVCFVFSICLISDIRALWRSALSARVPECQKLKT